MQRTYEGCSDGLSGVVATVIHWLVLLCARENDSCSDVVGGCFGYAVAIRMLVVHTPRGLQMHAADAC